MLFAPVAQLSERSPPKAVVAGEIPAGSSGAAAFALSSFRLRISLRRDKSARQAIFRASGSEGIADPTDRESVSLGGASPLSPTNSMESKPQQTGTGLLIRHGEVATTSGSTNSFAGSSNRRTAPFEGANAGAIPAPAAKFQSPLAQNQSGSPTNCGRWRITSTGYHLPCGVIRSAPVSDTGGLGAKPGKAANFNKAQTPTIYVRHIEQEHRAAT